MTPSLKELKKLAELARDLGNGCARSINPATILKLIDALEIQRKALESIRTPDKYASSYELHVCHFHMEIAKEALEKTKELFIL